MTPNWMILNLYIGNGCFTKRPFLTGCLGYQGGMLNFQGVNLCFSGSA